MEQQMVKVKRKRFVTLESAVNHELEVLNKSGWRAVSISTAIDAYDQEPVMYLLMQKD